jgi:uncharacterized protein with von Willebrand factor type A (vWA) domain
MPPPERHDGGAPSAGADAHEAAREAAVALARALRARGLIAGVDRELVLCRALAEVDVRRRDRVYWAARAAFVTRPGEVAAFDSVFDRFWDGLPLDGSRGRAEHGESDPRMTGPQHGGESLPQFRTQGRSQPLVDGPGGVRSEQEIPSRPGDDSSGGRRHGALAAYSPQDAEEEPRALDYARDELAAVRRLAEELRALAPERRSRRLRAGGRGDRLDVRRTIRRSLRTEGEAMRPAFAAPGRKPRRIVLLCDVSGSMERYSRALLGSLQAAVEAGIKAEAFVFATRLTRLTGALGGHDAACAMERAREAVADWSGGTRIGAALADFNARFAPLGLARGAIVIVVSDGWDRGDPEALTCELSRLRLQARRLIWINPHPAMLDHQPLAVGMRAALPHVDDFVAGHDPGATAALARLIGGLGAGRPARRQRPAGPMGAAARPHT